MPAITPELIRTCKSCSRDLAPGALACEQCHSLVHAGELDQLASEANALEAKGGLRQARERWLQGLPLLPRESKQSEWIRDKASALEQAANAAEAPEPENKWVRKLAPLGPVAIVLAKSKALLTALFNLKFLLSMMAFMAFYWKVYGAKFGIGFAVLILIHEMGHFIDVKRRGLPAEMPVFLPGVGAYVRWQALGVGAEVRAAVSLAGPLAGWVASVACAVLWWKTGNGMWAALARAGACLNVLNLVPVWVLDGGQAASALSKAERALLLITCIGLWLGLGEGVFFLVALGFGWRLFTRDLPAHPSRATTIYFIAVLIGLGIVMWLMPGHGFGPS